MPIVQLLLAVAGFVLWGFALRNMTPGTPYFPTWNWRYWKPVWKMHPYFNRVGYYQNYVGTTLVAIAFVPELLPLASLVLSASQ
ncbi:MAG: hypothetical protein Q8Q20_00705 [bacterium]|nr:hypothetical protein [bacterium]